MIYLCKLYCFDCFIQIISSDWNISRF